MNVPSRTGPILALFAAITTIASPRAVALGPGWSSSPPHQTPQATARLHLSPSDAGSRAMLVLDIQLARGWHTYFVNSGDSGAGPQISLNAPEGASLTPLPAPVPQQFQSLGVTTYGYTGRVLFPLTVALPEGAVRVEAAADYLVCADICLAESISATLPVATGPWPDALPDTPEAPQARQAIAGPIQAAGTTYTLEIDDSLFGLEPRPPDDLYFFALEWGHVDHAAPQVTHRPSDGPIVLSWTAGPLKPAAETIQGLVGWTDEQGSRRGAWVPALPAALTAFDPTPSPQDRD